jgi:hypothetical protein
MKTQFIDQEKKLSNTNVMCATYLQLQQNVTLHMINEESANIDR